MRRSARSLIGAPACEPDHDRVLVYQDPDFAHGGTRLLGGQPTAKLGEYPVDDTDDVRGALRQGELAKQPSVCLVELRVELRGLEPLTPCLQT
jgi:hypothetical protein